MLLSPAVVRGALTLAIAGGMLPSRSDAQRPARAPEVTIAASERHVMRSPLTGMTYQVDVVLPRDYGMSSARYSVAYALDGDFALPILAASHRALTANRLLPQQLIIVGIDYQASVSAGAPNWRQVNRTHDYAVRRDSSGVEHGAPEFLRFLREQLFPFVDSAYRTLPGDRTILGHSYGGLFATYVLTHQPDTFQRYAIGSPALRFGGQAAFQWEATYAATHKALPARVFFYTGELELGVIREPAERFWSTLQSRNYANLDLTEFLVIPGEDIMSVGLTALGRALRALYARREVRLPVAMLAPYAGEWKSADHSWKIRLDGGHLSVNVGGFPALSAPWELHASSDTSFFTKPVEFSFVFAPDTKGNPSDRLLLVTSIGSTPDSLRKVSSGPHKP